MSGVLSLSQKRKRGKQRSEWMGFLLGNLGREREIRGRKRGLSRMTVDVVSTS